MSSEKREVIGFHTGTSNTVTTDPLVRIYMIWSKNWDGGAFMCQTTMARIRAIVPRMSSEVAVHCIPSDN